MLPFALIAAAAFALWYANRRPEPPAILTVGTARYQVSSVRPDGSWWLSPRPEGPRDPTPAPGGVLYVYDPRAKRITGTIPLGDPAPTTQEDGTPLR